MGDIRYLPSARTNAARLLERVVEETIRRHPDAGIAARWSSMARETIARWPGPPAPSVASLEFDAGLDDARRAELIALLERWMESYFGDVRDQLMDMHGEMLTLQRRVAELEADCARADAARSPDDRRS